MKSKIALLFVLIAVLAGCEQQETYPISGEECSADDPVQTLDTAPCPPSTGGGGF